jgi:hypothetical protein
VTGGGERTASLRWTLTCANAETPFATVSLDKLAEGPLTFDVPTDCGAQRLELTGSSSDIPQQADVTISQVSLTRANPHG